MENTPPEPLPPAPLMSAGLLLARNHILTMAWLDSDLVVTGRFGELAPALEVGEPLSFGLPVLADYQDDIRALPCDGRTPFELPGILLVGNEGKPTSRIDIIVFRHAEMNPAGSLTATNENSAPGTPGTPGQHSQFLLLITRAGARSMDIAVARLQRDRQMLLEDVEQKKLELDRLNAELEITNRDLEDFATVISHDLKAPMRALRYLADDIETALDRGNPQHARTACEAIKKQSRRMSSMLSDLLDYASVGRKREIIEPCDTRTLVESIAVSLPRPAGMSLKIGGEWPTIETYIAPLDLVIRNLLDNAIKHHDRGESGQIRIIAAVTGDTLDIAIQDDGPGIPLARQEAIFYPFRSYPNLEAETGAEQAASSQGMGLAFVKRTIESIGGSLSLTSDPRNARGSRFELSWPLRLE